MKGLFSALFLNTGLIQRMIYVYNYQVQGLAMLYFI